MPAVFLAPVKEDSSLCTAAPFWAIMIMSALMARAAAGLLSGPDLPVLHVRQQEQQHTWPGLHQNAPACMADQGTSS